MIELEWIKKQGNCCIEDCSESPCQADDMDNVFCNEHAEQSRQEEPENWPVDALSDVG